MEDEEDLLCPANGALLWSMTVTVTIDPMTGARYRNCAFEGEPDITDVIGTLERVKLDLHLDAENEEED